jgi:ribosome-associated protein
MSRKPKRGYFVRGQFVAEGSELDLELKRELKGTDSLSKTDLKRESDALQTLGQDLLTLRRDLMDRLQNEGHLKDALLEAINEAKRITNFEGKRRQMQFIGKLMRKADEDSIAAMREALEEQRTGHGRETLALHQAEQWRDRLIQDDDALSEWMAQFPDTDSQQLRALIRQARKDGLPDKTAISQGLLPRQGRAFREVFQLVKAQLADHD